MIAQEGEFSVFYECNPEKNVQCGKEHCHINGGPCTQTKNVMYAVDATKATMIIPMSQEDYSAMKNEDGQVEVSLEKTDHPAQLQPHPSLDARNRKERRHGRKE